MGALSTIARNVASNAAGYVVALVLALVVAPFAAEALGKQLYGVWLVIVSVTGYYGILDLGLRSAVAQYLTRAWTQGDRQTLNQVVSTALALTTGIAGLLLLVSGLIAWRSDLLFTVQGQTLAEVQEAVLVFGIGVALSFPMAVFGSAIQARQRFDLLNVIGIAERLVTNGLYLWALDAGHGILELAWITTLGGAAGHAARAVVALRLLPGLELGVRFVDRATVKKLFGFGVFSFLVSTSDRLVLYTDTLVIQLVLDEVAVTYYSWGVTLVHHYLGIVNMVAWTLTPHATALDAKQNLDGLRHLWLAGSRSLVQIAVLVGGGLLFCGRDFLQVWVGEEYLLGTPYTSSATVMAVLTVAALLRSLMTCGKQVLYGMREVRSMARLAVGEALANVVLSVPLAIWLGNLGVALGTLLPSAVVNLWLQPRIVARQLGVGYGRFVAHVVPPALLVLAAMAIARELVGWYVPVTGWGSFGAVAGVVGLVGAVASWSFGIGPAERQRLLARLRR